MLLQGSPLALLRRSPRQPLAASPSLSEVSIVRDSRTFGGGEIREDGPIGLWRARERTAWTDRDRRGSIDTRLFYRLRK